MSPLSIAVYWIAIPALVLIVSQLVGILRDWIREAEAARILEDELRERRERRERPMREEIMDHGA